MFNKNNLKDIYTLSPMQEGMLFHSVLDQQSSAYIEQSEVLIEGDFDPALFGKSWQTIIERHDVFRSVYVTKKTARPIQVVLKTVEFTPVVTDLSGKSEDEVYRELESFRQQDIKAGFDLATGPLFRLAMFKLDDKHTKVFWTFHHIIMDGWSLGLVLNELFCIYASLKQQKQLTLPTPVPYSHYIKWLATRDAKAGLDFWSERLKTVEQQCLLPQRADVQPGFDLAIKPLKLDKTVFEQINRFCQQHGLTLNNYVQAAWALCLNLYTGQDNLIFGKTVAGRSAQLPQAEDIVGLFINTLPVHIELHSGESFVELVKRVQQDAFACDEYDWCSLANIQNETALKSDLINHIMVFENYPLDPDNGQWDGLDLGFKIKDVSGAEHTNYDFEIIAMPGETLGFDVKYNQAKYDEATLNTVMSSFLQLCQKAVESPDSDCLSLNTVDDTTLAQTEQTAVNESVLAMFKRQVQNNPDAIALVGEDAQMSYRELDEKSTQFAAGLIEKHQVKPGQLIAVMVNHNQKDIVSFLGIIKAGAAYMPLDPSYPQDKIDFMLQDSGCQLMLTEAVESDVVFDDITPDLDACVYVIYTSGSTGKPKGCQIAHRNLAALIDGSKQGFDFNQNDKWVVAHSMCFDFSVWEMYGALCFGGTLHLPNRDVVADTKLFYSYLVDHQITVLNQTPAAFYQLIEQDAQQQKPGLKNLHTVCFGGDRLDLKPIKRWAVKYPLCQTKLVNMYGITETTVHVSYKRITDADLQANTGQSPIGKPIPNVSMILLDKFGRLVPNNVVGEIYVGGAGVSLGYLNRDELNRERFVPNPYNSSETLYRTGDLAKRDDNGELIYLGRNDFQVQIRGFRVELGEISYRLQQLEQIKDAVVLAAKDGERADRLVAFCIADSFDVAQIRRQLAEHLADYMIPTQIYPLESFPLTSNNKIDRNALLALETDVLSQGLTQTYVAPRNDLERQIATIWQSILGLEKVGIEDNFFNIGGHSIKATLLVTQLSKALSVDFSLKEVFETPTIAGLAHRAQFKQPSLYAQIEQAPEQAQYELSYAQKRLWTLDRIQREKVQGGSHAYNLHGAFVVNGAVDINKIEHAFALLLQRHDALRLAFVEVDGIPYQQVQSADGFKVLTEQVSSIEQAKQHCQQEIEHSFDLAKGDLFRVKLFILPDASIVMSLCLHHIIADGWSIGVLLNEFSSLYAGKSELAPLPIQYNDFVHWQNEAIRSDAMNSQRDYWLYQLGGELPVLELPTDYPRPAEKSFAGAVLHFDLPTATFEQLQAFNESKQLTLFMGLIGFYHLTLFKYTGQQQIIIGIPISGRYHPDLNDQIGYYLNTLPIKLEVSATDSLEGYFKRLKETVKNAFDNQVYPFDELMDQLEIENNPGRSGLYDVMFGLQNFDQGELSLYGEGGDAKGEVLAIDSPTSKFDLTMVCEENNGALGVNLEFATDLFKVDTIKQLQQHFVQLMQGALAKPQAEIGQLSVLSGDERSRIVDGFNVGAKTERTSNHSIIELFKTQVAKQTNKTALAFADETMSYLELDEWSNQIAYTLLNSMVIEPQDRIAIYADRSPWMIACILAVLKTGAAYVPVDPKNPKARTEFLLQDSQSRLILTHAHYRDELAPIGLPLLTKQDTVRGVKSPINREYQPNHLAYIMYTSGSSGTPKGVLVEQRCVVDLVKNSNYTDVQPHDKLLQLSNYAFDGSVYDIFAALLSGASLHLIDNDMLLSPNRLCDFIKEQQVNITFITTALINTLVDIEPQIISQFDKIYFGGQEASLKHIQTALDHRKHSDSIVHVYGPTETTTFAAYHVVESIDSKVGNIPIGAALSQKQLYVLDEQMQVVPVGVTGEIYIGGTGVARSYLNRPKETEQAFLTNPFDASSQLYKTNDLGRWNRDGQIEFLGRKDLQVKIRGFRVEIGEVENAILRHQSLAKVFVMAWSEYEGANKQLVAYCVCNNELSMQALRTWLSGFLPDYMVPAHFIKMDELPLNSNGKVERKKLPMPDLDADENSDNFVAPKTAMEQLLSDVWSPLLGRSKISIQDNYFALGGDSIKAIQMIAALQSHQYKMEVKDLYTFPTIESLAPCLVALDGGQTGERQTGEFAFTPIQNWFVSEKTGPLDVFNQDMLLRWNGEVDVDQLTDALNTIVDFHDLLRASMPSEGVLQVSDQVVINLEQIQLEDDTDQLMIDTTQTLNQQMNLVQGPLLRAALISRPDGQYLYLVAHHMVIDGVSWRILLEDLQNLCSDKTELVRTGSAKGWVEYLEKTYRFADQIDYWSNRDEQPHGTLNLQTPETVQVCSEQRSLDVDLTDKLLTTAHESFNTQINDLLLFALARALQDSHGMQNSLIHLEGHGREAFDDAPDITRTIGWFTSMYPVSIASQGDDDFSGQVKQFKEQLRDIPDKGLGYGVLKYLQNAIDKDYRPSASFNYLGQFDGASQGGLFDMSTVKTAKTNADHLALTCPVDIVAHVESGQLQVSVFYAHTAQNQALVCDLLDSYIGHLQQVIGFCCDTDDFSLTPSDIDFDGFDIDGLDAVLDNL